MERHILLGAAGRSAHSGVAERQARLGLCQQGDQDGSVVGGGEVILLQQRIQHHGHRFFPVLMVQQPECLYKYINQEL